MFEWVTWFVCLVRLAMLDFLLFFFVVCVCLCVCIFVCVFLCVYTFLHSHSFSLNPQFVLVFICLPHSCATAYSWPSLFFFFSFCLVASLSLSLSCFSAFPSASPWPAFCVPDRSFRQVFLSRIQCDYWSRLFLLNRRRCRRTQLFCLVLCCGFFALLWGRWQSCLSLPLLPSPVTLHLPFQFVVVVWGWQKFRLYIFLPTQNY